MIAIVQRCSKATIVVNKEIISKINYGLIIFLGIFREDDESDCDRIIKKITHLRIFNDYDKKMNLSILDTEAEIMVISQFTLCGSIKKGRRPSFTDAKPPNEAIKLYNSFIHNIKKTGLFIQSGKFGSEMEVDFVNHGPVTFIVDSKKL